MRFICLCNAQGNNAQFARVQFSLANRSPDNVLDVKQTPVRKTVDLKINQVVLVRSS